MKRTKNKFLIILLSVLAMVFISLGIFTAPVKTFADQAEDDVVRNLIDSADISIMNGAQCSAITPHTIIFGVNAPEQGFFSSFKSKLKTATFAAVKKQRENYILSLVDYEWVAETGLLLVDQTKVDGIYEDMSNVTLSFNETRYVPFSDPLDGGFIDIDNPRLLINKEGTTYSVEPDFICLHDSTSDLTTWERISCNVGKENTSTNYIPIYFIYARYVTQAPLISSFDFEFSHQRLFTNFNSIRSCSYISNITLENGNYPNDDVKRVLEANVNSPTLITMEPDGVVDSLLKTAPLNFRMMAGAELENAGYIKWSCLLNASSYSSWKNQCKNITLSWIVVDFNKYKEGDFEHNYHASERKFPECELLVNGNDYISTIKYNPPAGKEDVYYIAIPYIECVSSIAMPELSSNTLYIKNNAETNGTYIIAPPNDNARSMNSLVSAEGEYNYYFNYLENIEGTPFAELKTVNIKRSSRLDFNIMTMDDYAEIIGVETVDGKLRCLMSTASHMIINQTATDLYNVYAMYSLIPLTFVNDSGETSAQNLGIVPFSNIDTENTYAKNITSLKDKNGVPYFKTLDEIEPSKLYGYFYTYSYESEHENPNWDINKDEYDGYISYFTELKQVEYKVGYLELGTIGLGTGAAIGATIGVLAGGPAGLLIGTCVGGVCGALLTGGVPALFGMQKESETIYHNVEYGFLDCTNSLPQGGYDTNKDPLEKETPAYVSIIIIVLAIIELFFISFAFVKFGPLPIVFKIILLIILIALCVWADITIWLWMVT